MSNTAYPASIDSPTNPGTGSTLATVPHHLQHGLENDAIVALETKLGTGSSLQTPVQGGFLVSNSNGASQWQVAPTSPQFTTGINDPNGKVWIGQTPAGASAVNYVNISNSVTTVAPSISALGTDGNISLNLVPKGSGKVQDNGTNLIDFRNSFASFILAGTCVWTVTSGLAAQMSAGSVFIAGAEYALASVGTHTFGTSVDTYIDYTVGTGITYTAVANNATSPSLAANSVRIAKVVTSGAAVTSIVQIGFDTSAGRNQIYNTSPTPVALSFNPVKFHYHRVAAYTLTGSSFTKFPLDTKDWDTSSNYDNVTNFRFTAPTAGFYHFNGRVDAGAAASTRILGLFYKNGVSWARGTDYAINGTLPSASVVSDEIQLAAGDYVELWYFSTQAVATEATGNDINYFSGFLVSGT